MPSFTVFRPPSSLGTLCGLGIVGLSLLLGLVLLYQGLTMNVGLAQLLPLLAGGFFLCLAALYTYWTWGCGSLRYIVDRNALTIRWGSLRQVVPIANIERLIPGSEHENPSIEGVNWVGHHVGKGVIEPLGEVLFYSTHRSMDEVLYVQTPSETYAISVGDQVFFAETVQSNQSRGALFEQRQAVHRWGIAAQSFWLDGRARLLAVILFASFVVVLAYVLQTYPGLSDVVSLRFPAYGGVARQAHKSDLLDIPRSAAAFLFVDFVLALFLHSWERMVGYVLLLAGIAAEVMLFVAAVVAVA